MKEVHVLSSQAGFCCPRLDFSLQGLDVGGLGLALTLPSRNTVMCLDIGYRSRSGSPFPAEEVMQFVTAQPCAFSMIFEDVRRILHEDWSGPVSTVEQIRPMISAFGDVLEDLDSDYGQRMDAYREAVLSYLDMTDKRVLRRPESEQFELDKQLFHEAATNIIGRYNGPKAEPESLITELAIFCSTAAPSYRQFLKSCAKVTDNWDSFAGVGKNLFRALHPQTRDRPVLDFPMDHFHLAVSHAFSLVSEIWDYYDTLTHKARLLSIALPAAITGIDYALGSFLYFNFLLSPADASNMKGGVKLNVLPRVRKLFKASGRSTKELLKVWGDSKQCRLSKSFQWIVDPDLEIQRIAAEVGGDSTTSFLTHWYAQRVSVLVELLYALEETIVEQETKCVYCREMMLSFLPAVGRDLTGKLRGRYVSKAPELVPLLNEASGNIPSSLLDIARNEVVAYVRRLEPKDGKLMVHQIGSSS